MTAKTLMVWGCTSDAGKSFLAAALCRYFSDKGLRVAPFKAQNMSNNARVAHGGEMGCAQWFQAKAARCIPEVRHNPVLLKPERDTHSQVVVMGQVDRELSSMDWRGRSPLLWERAKPALHEIMSENDIVVIEGAGSPAEINLAGCDYVNLMTARESSAACLLVSDIDRGGSFAHLYGTWALLPDDLRSNLKGFVLNKFRGDANLLEPGPSELLRRTGVPLVGVVPRVRHDLPDEDAVALDHFETSDPASARFRVALVAWPRISNFDEFRRLAAWPGVSLRLARRPSDLDGADLAILPGSKNVPSDLEWLRDRGLDRAMTEFARSGGAVLGVCGGLQALGVRIDDPVGTEGDAQGLGLLPLSTVHGATKIVRDSSLSVPVLDGFWSKLSGQNLSGYEIRTGATAGLDPASGEGRLACAGNVLGTYLHGAFEDPATLAALFGGDPASPDPLERTLRDMAGLVERHLDMDMVESWLAAPAIGANLDLNSFPVRPEEPTQEASRRAGGVGCVPGAGPKDNCAVQSELCGGESSPALRDALRQSQGSSGRTEFSQLQSARLCVLTGGVRAGKSSAAQDKALAWGGQNVSVIATAQALDDEMRLRIANHQSERPAGWETIEEPIDVAAALRRASNGVVVLDCANLWVTNILLSKCNSCDSRQLDSVRPEEEAQPPSRRAEGTSLQGIPQSVDFRQSVDDLILAWRESGKDLVVVTNEVGWGIVPDNALSREFRDQLGWVNQRLVAASTEAWLYVSGVALPLKAAP